ncbi:MAG: DUF2752 domain-containing protein [Niabella sp.]|nr:DUF2752 domain-containing protein [Niabella sp.]
MNVKTFLKKYSEALIWGGALAALFFMNVDPNAISLCPLKALGIPWCPGCGIGHSIHYTLHLNFTAAWRAHFLGIPATLVLLYQTIKSLHFTNKNYNNGSATHIAHYSGY